jgi:ElaB/YqjD/DUF883 family membrane-anchored ribosome-binding protein
MNSKPKNLRDAIEELESQTEKTGLDLKAKLQSELKNLEEQIKNLKPQLEELANEGVAKAKDKVEAQIRENPWQTLGVFALIGFVLGFLFANTVRGRRD